MMTGRYWRFLRGLLSAQRASEVRARLTELENISREESARLDWVLDNALYIPIEDGRILPENSREAIDAERQRIADEHAAIAQTIVARKVPE